MPDSPPSPGDALIAEMTLSGTQIVARLAKAINVATSDAIPLSALVECDFPGYAGVALNDFEDVLPDESDGGEVLSAIVQWIADGITTPQAAVAVYVTGQIGSDPPFLMNLEVFDGEFLFVEDDDTLERQFRSTQSVDA